MSQPCRRGLLTGVNCGVRHGRGAVLSRQKMTARLRPALGAGKAS